MKKALIIIALFIGLGNVNAQSDAKPTKKETVSYIQKQLKKLEFQIYTYPGLSEKYKHDAKTTLIEFSENTYNNIYIFSNRNKEEAMVDENDWYDGKFSLSEMRWYSAKIKSAGVHFSVKEIGRITISFSESYIKSSEGQKNRDKRDVTFYVPIEYLKNTEKAFNRLIDLSIKEEKDPFD